MDIKIYEDQTGLLIYPEKGTDKNGDIVRLFDNKIELYIKKYGDMTELSCYVFVRKGVGRAIGCYIIYKDTFTDNSEFFSNFKDEAAKVLGSIGFSPHDDIENENAIFNEIQKFDFVTKFYCWEHIASILESGESLYYTAGNIPEIGGFTRQILQSLKNIRISISTRDNSLAELNILRKKLDEPLVPTEKTKQSIARYQDKINQKLLADKLAKERDKLEKRRKEQEEALKREIEKPKKEREKYNTGFTSEVRAIKEKDKEIGIKKIDDGFRSISEGALSLTNNGYINELLNFSNRLDSINNVFKSAREKAAKNAEAKATAKELENEKPKEIPEVYKEEEKTSSTPLYIAGLAGIILILIGATMAYDANFLHLKETISGNQTQTTPATTPTSSLTPEQPTQTPPSWKSTDTPLPLIDGNQATTSIPTPTTTISTNMTTPPTPIPTNTTTPPPTPTAANTTAQPKQT